MRDWGLTNSDFREGSESIPANAGVSVVPARAPIVERPSFRRVYDDEFAFVWRTLARLGVHASDLPDAAQDVFIVVQRHLEHYDPARPLRPWLVGIAHRVATAERRRARHRREVLGEGATVEMADRRPTPEALVSSQQRRDRVHAALETLDMDRRVVFVMYEMEQIPGVEIAEALGIPINTVYSRLRVARDRFKAAVIRLRHCQGEA